MSSPRSTGLIWALATVGLAAGTSFLVSRSDQRTTSAKPSEQDFHRWMHTQLALTPAEHEALEPIELADETERRRLREEIVSAGRELADAVRQGKSGSPEIEAALTRLNAAQATLQRATLSHFFAMKEHLDPEQAEKLLQWTHDSILPE
ncbi:periplasmic heavy metal sensor [Luteolibacter arcticus]|uniref:Periplasmic heavy metal sensor n=1 Tax=Luteolibacter arcticus TaxID=1581411 RepID=A0ABT3GI19_9BACT|nr:periplasmic heavy metal sensor [Luteolibacter arcticus]MCW1923145.1 periplasmic heavy metal sensor [Luteolibacter arcticus]